MISANNVTLRIGKKAFYGATELSEVVIPSTVLRIEQDAFLGCNSLKRVTVPMKFQEQMKDIFGNTDFEQVIYV